MSEEAMEYFPSWKYHKEKKAVVVQNEEEEKALGPGWEDSPAKFPDKRVEQAEIRDRHWKEFEAAVNNPAERVRLYIEYSTMHPALAAADSRYKETAPLIPVLQTQAALERQVEDRERPVIKVEAAARPAAAPAQPPPATVANRGDKKDQINAFITKVLTEKGRKITRKDIWTVAGYKDKSDFARFQRGDTKTTKAAAIAFNWVLNMNPDDFMRLLENKLAAK